MQLKEYQSCCALANATRIEDVCPNKINAVIPNTNCSCVDYLFYQLAVVTAFSSDHFNEAQDMIASVQTNMPNIPIYVYDLGLKSNEIKSLLKLCQVRVRTFPFDKYPPHFGKLALNEAWKPIIISELAEEYDVVLYGDASLRILKPVKNDLLPLLLEFPYIGAPAVRHAVLPTTPPEMYDYLGLNLTRKEAWKAMPNTIQSTMMCIWATKLIQDKFLKYWVDCAMHKECMSPDGYVRRVACEPYHPEKENPNYAGEYVGCMRCQSIVNILLYREFGAKVWNRVHHDELQGSVWTIEKHVTKRFQAKLCPAS